MHDIICPHCGESFVASDVAFDLSSYILPLLCSDPRDAEDVMRVGFRFLVDEDCISNQTVSGNHAPLRINNEPNATDQWYPFVVTNRLISDHIASQIVVDGGGNLKDIIAQIAAVRGTRNASYTMLQVRTVEKIYRRFFAAADKQIVKDSAGQLDMNDENVQTVIKILSHVFTEQSDTVTLSVRLYTPKNYSRYHLPDVLYVLSDDYTPKPHPKCCRFCGTKFPKEFGYYKMIPVVLLGSHYSGKTSYLLSLLYTTQYMPPFAVQVGEKAAIMTSTLSDDDDLVAFQKNMERFGQGLPPDKTDFKNVPILNLRVNDLIYTFIDWPGEKFIDDEAKHDDSFANEYRRVITKARHFLCFLEPAQVDHIRNQSEERVRFSAAALGKRFSDHFRKTNLSRLRSVTYVFNKADLYGGDANNAPNPNAAAMLNLLNQESETTVFEGGKFRADKFAEITKICESFLFTQNPPLHSYLTKMDVFQQSGAIAPSFLPVSPYGATVSEDSREVLHHTRFAGIPLLHILNRDKDLCKNQSAGN